MTIRRRTAWNPGNSPRSNLRDSSHPAPVILREDILIRRHGNRRKVLPVTKNSPTRVRLGKSVGETVDGAIPVPVIVVFASARHLSGYPISNAYRTFLPLMKYYTAWIVVRTRDPSHPIPKSGRLQHQRERLLLSRHPPKRITTCKRSAPSGSPPKVSPWH